MYYGVHLHNATNNTREVEGGPKILKRACYRALFDVVNRIRPIDLRRRGRLQASGRGTAGALNEL